MNKKKEIVSDIIDAVVSDLPITEVAVREFDYTDYTHFSVEDKYGNMRYIEVLERTARYQIKIGYENLHKGHFEVSVSKQEDVKRVIQLLLHTDWFCIHPDYHDCPYVGCDCQRADKSDV